MSDVTKILQQIDDGDPSAAEKLLPLVYDELRRLAAARMSAERVDHTLQATALVHEAYVRLVQADVARHWNDRAHFFRAAAEAMRRILVDVARRKRTIKHGGEFERIDLEQFADRSDDHSEQLLCVHEALDRLAAAHPDKVELVKLRYFTGLTVEEAAEMLGISRATADRHWGFARTWLYCELRRGQADDREFFQDL
jgi:RNA polymerase sigma factor (TIGR02999 family)